MRGESSQGLEVDSESGFALADGALALLCRPTGKAAFRRGALGGDPAQEWLPLSIPLNTDIRQVGDVKGHLNLPAQPGLPEAVRAGFTRLAGDFPQLNWVREEWFGQGRPDGRCLGPFELASQLRAAQRDRLDELLLISFDPFGMVVEGVTPNWREKLMHKVKLAAITCELPARSYENDDPVFAAVPDLSESGGNSGASIGGAISTRGTARTSSAWWSGPPSACCAAAIPRRIAWTC